MGVIDFGRAGAIGPTQSAVLGDDRACFTAADYPVVMAAQEVELVRVGGAAASPVV